MAVVHKLHFLPVVSLPIIIRRQRNISLTDAIDRWVTIGWLQHKLQQPNTTKIRYSSLKIVPDIRRHPFYATQQFPRIVSPWRCKPNYTKDITQGESTLSKFFIPGTSTAPSKSRGISSDVLKVVDITRIVGRRAAPVSWG